MSAIESAAADAGSSSLAARRTLSSEASLADCVQRVAAVAARLSGAQRSEVWLVDGERVRAWSSAARAPSAAALADHALTRLEPGSAALASSALGLAAGVAQPIVHPDGGLLGALVAFGDGLEARSDVHELLGELAGVVAGIVLSAELASERADELVALRSELRSLRASDPLTGLLNRRALHERLDAALALARRTEHTLALAHVEVVGLRDVVEQHGSALADAVVLQVAHALQDAVRDHDLVARVGVASFAVAWQGVDERTAAAAAHRVVAHVAGPFRLAAEGVPGVLEVVLGARLGYALHPKDAEDLFGLLRAADVAAARAQRDGRSVVAYADDVLNGA